MGGNDGVVQVPGIVSADNISAPCINDNNDVTGITMPGGGEYSYSYDNNRLPTETVSATGVRTSCGYDAYGNSTSAGTSSSDENI